MTSYGRSLSLSSILLLASACSDDAGNTVEDASTKNDSAILDGALNDAQTGTNPDGALASDAAADASSQDAATNADALVDGASQTGQQDPFGITMLHPTAAGGNTWDSQHWNNGNPRSVLDVKDRDPDDPTGWSMLRGSGLGNPPLQIDGSGIATLRGDQPRIYLDGSADEEGFVNVEATMYYQRVEDDDTAWGGAIFGVRSSAVGHSEEPCQATTYYARLRHDGRHDFAKELEHPTAEAVDRQTVFADGLPRDTWIGVKYVARNVGTDRVRLEHYVDLTGGVDGGDFKLVGSYEDSGTWEAEQDSACGRPDNFVITEGGGMVFIRTTMGNNSEAKYRWVSVREIDPLS